MFIEKNCTFDKNIIMKKLVLFLAFALAFSFGCKKDNLQDCEVNKTGSLKVLNYSQNPYKIFVDGVFWGNVAGNSNILIDVVGAGIKDIKAEQISGFILFPTTFQNNVTITSCNTMEFYFP
jgi:hypothetical protein